MRRKLPTSSYGHSRIITMIDFLNTITMDEAIALKAQFMPSRTYERFINSTHIDGEITIDEIASFIGRDMHDGE
jgi:hypothetical protein